MKKYLLFLLLLLPGIIPLNLAAQWSNNPAVNNVICNSSGEQAIPKIATCPNGDSYIGYFSSEGGNYNIRLQRLDALGNIQWAANGILISNHPQETWLTDWDMTCDAANHAILAFNDIRMGGTNVVVYRISPSGSFVWGNDGILLSNTTAFNAAPKVISTNAGNIVVAWQADDVIIMQKLNAAGALQWGPAGITLTSANTLSWPQLMPVGTDDFILKYFDDSGPGWSPTRHVFARRYGPAGTPVWSAPATISNAGGISAWTQIFPFINDGSDGFYIAWHDDRDNNQRASTFVQHVSSTGALLFPANGVEASLNASMNHYYPQLALPPGSSDVFVYWNEMNGNQDNWGIFGQKINASGTLQWGNNGMTFIPVTTTNVYPYEARNSPTDMVLIYEEYANTIAGKIKAMRISATGSFLWSPAQKEICSVISEKVHPVVNEFANNQWIAAWEDNRNTDKDIYAQNIQLDGTLGPAFSGILSGTITLNGGGGNVTQVLVKAGSTTTYPDPTGFYSMTVVSGTYTVTASLAGYQTATQPNVVVNTNQTTTVNLTLNPEPVGYIHGTVVLNGGTGIITQVVVQAGSVTTTPNQNGTYTLIVPPGTWNVIANLGGYYPDTVMNVAVANQQTVSGVNLTLDPMPTNGTITGTVILNGGSGNVTQAVVSAGGGVATTSPNATGFYTLTLPAGNYDVTASLSGYGTQTITGVPVVVSQTTPNVNFTLSPLSGSGNIQGTVTINGGAANVTQATVTAGTWSVHPDASGYYDIAVPPGNYNVTAVHPYTSSSTVSNIVVVAGQVVSNVNFLLTIDKADMIVRAEDNFGTTLNNVDVSIQGPGGPYVGVITGDSLVFPHVPYGQYHGMALWYGLGPVLSDTTINSANHHLVFVFLIDGIREKSERIRMTVAPNPAGPESTVQYSLPSEGKWKLEMKSVMGATIGFVEKILEPGIYQITLSDLTGTRYLPEGVYLVQLTGPAGESFRCKIIWHN
jgi:hypothetical protein